MKLVVIVYINDRWEVGLLPFHEDLYGQFMIMIIIVQKCPFVFLELNSIP